MEKITFIGLCTAFWSIFMRKTPLQITHANHMTMTTSGQILLWPDYHKKKENVNIKLLDLWESSIVYILLSTCQWVQVTFAINIPDIILM